MRRSDELFFLFDHLIVLFVRTYPKPNVGFPFLNTKSSPIQSNSYRIDFRRIVQFFKMKGWVISIFLPKLKGFIGLKLNFFWKIRVKPFEILISY